MKPKPKPRKREVIAFTNNKGQVILIPASTKLVNLRKLGVKDIRIVSPTSKLKSGWFRS